MAQITKEQLDTLNRLLGELNNNIKKTNTPSDAPAGGGGYSFEGGSQRDQIRYYEQVKEQQREILASTELEDKLKQRILENLQDQNRELSEAEELQLKILQGEQESIDYAKEQLSIAEENLKVLEEHRKAIGDIVENYENASLYGENMAKSFGSMLGMSAPKKGGVMDVVSNLAAGGELRQKTFDGLKKGLKETFTASSIAVAGMQKLVEATLFVGKAFDDMAVSYGKATGTGRQFTSQVIEASIANRDFLASTEEQIKSTITLQNALGGLSGITKDTVISMQKVQIATERLGVSSQDYTAIMSDQVAGMGKTTKEAEKSFAGLQAAAQNMGMSFGDLTSQYRGSMSTFSAFGSNMEKAFVRTASTARQLGIEMGTVISLGEKFDTFDGAADSVADLNYIMGGQFFDTMEMMRLQAEEGPEAVTAAIKKQFEASGKSFEDFSYSQRKALAQAMGMSEDEAKKMMTGTLDEAKVDAAEAAAATGDIEKLNELGEDTLKTFEKLGIIMKNAFTDSLKFIEPFVKQLNGFISDNKEMMGTVAKGALAVGGIATAAAGAKSIFNFFKGDGRAGGLKKMLKGDLLGGGLQMLTGGTPDAAGTGKLGTQGNPMYVKIVGSKGGLIPDVSEILDSPLPGDSKSPSKVPNSKLMGDAELQKRGIMPRGTTTSAPKKVGFFGGLMNKAKSLGGRAMKGIKGAGAAMNPAKLLKSGIAKNAGKIMSKAAGPVVKTIMNIAEFGTIMASDDDKKTKSKKLVRASGGLLGGILGGIAAGTIGSVGGPAAFFLGGLGAMAGDYLGRLMFDMPIVQNLLAPLVEEHILGGSGAAKTPTQSAAKPISPKPSAKKVASGVAGSMASALGPPKDSSGNRLDHMDYNGVPVVRDGQWVNQGNWKEMGFDPKLASMSPKDFMNMPFPSAPAAVPAAPQNPYQNLQNAPLTAASTTNVGGRQNSQDGKSMNTETRVNIHVDDRKLKGILTAVAETVVAPK